MTLQNARGLLVIAHTHADFLPALDQYAMLSALPPQALALPREVLPLREEERIVDLTRADWQGMRARQARWVRQVLRPAMSAHPDYELVYFGATYIPLALDLGYRVQDFRPLHIFQHHHVNLDWRWPSAGAGVPPLQIKPDGLPEIVNDAAGDAVVRVSTSYGIRDADVQAIIPEPIADVHVHLGDRLDLDALRSPGDLNAVLSAVQSALDAVHQKRPGVARIHLLVCGPVGLAFRIGASINTTNQPPVVTWKFVRGATPHYRRAFALRRTIENTMRKIAFITAVPNTTSPIRFDKEHREIMRRLRNSHEDIGLEEYMAAQRSELQDLLDPIPAPVLHLSGHGAEGGILYLEGADRGREPIRPAAIVNLLDLVNESQKLRCVVFNTCYSAVLAEAVCGAGAVPFAIGMSGEINDESAILFAEGFYRALANGHGVHRAFRFGKNQIELSLLHERDAELPRFFAAPGADPSEALFS